MIDDATTAARELYIDLLERSVRGLLHPSYAVVDGPDGCVLDPETRVVRPRRDGDIHVLGVETMLNPGALRNLRECVASVLADGVPGDLIETGVWRGGATILMRGILAAHGVTDRTVWVADSFQGLPPPDAERYPADAGDRHHTRDVLAVSLDEVRAAFEAHGLLDEQVRFLEGWFRDTLPTVRDRRWALLRLDGDMYESTMDGLVNLYPGLSAGGYVIADDYATHPAHAQAIDDYRREHGIADPLTVDAPFAWWRRSA